MTGKLVVARGLPGSGKSTYAVAWQETKPDKRTRINRDDLRKMLYGKYWGLTNEQEQYITDISQQMALKALKKGDVIIDATHLRSSHVRDWQKLVKPLGYEVEVIEFNTPLEVCIERDSLRERTVGADVITGMYDKFLKPNGGKLPKVVDWEPEEVNLNQYVPDLSKPTAIIVDIDGTVAHRNGRNPYDYSSKVLEDTPDATVVEIVQRYSGIVDKIIFLSGRKDTCLVYTQQWIDKYIINQPKWSGFAGIPSIFMRKKDDNRKDSIVKLEIFDEYIRDKYNVLFALDDRDQVVSAFRGIGLKVLQVAEGNF